MARYFFDTDDDDIYLEDESGEVFTDAEAAREAALVALPEMARDKILTGITVCSR